METKLGIGNKIVGNRPIKSFRAGAVNVSVWKNAGKEIDGKEMSYNTISLERRYKDKDGTWKSTNSMRINDLPRAAAAINKAYDFLVFAKESIEVAEVEE